MSARHRLTRTVVRVADITGTQPIRVHPPLDLTAPPRDVWPRPMVYRGGVRRLVPALASLGVPVFVALAVTAGVAGPGFAGGALSVAVGAGARTRRKAAAEQNAPAELNDEKTEPERPDAVTATAELLAINDEPVEEATPAVADVTPGRGGRDIAEPADDGKPKAPADTVAVTCPLGCGWSTSWATQADADTALRGHLPMCDNAPTGENVPEPILGRLGGEVGEGGQQPPAEDAPASGSPSPTTNDQEPPMEDAGEGGPPAEVAGERATAGVDGAGELVQQPTPSAGPLSPAVKALLDDPWNPDRVRAALAEVSVEDAIATAEAADDTIVIDPRERLGLLDEDTRDRLGVLADGSPELTHTLLATLDDALTTVKRFTLEHHLPAPAGVGGWNNGEVIIALSAEDLFAWSAALTDCRWPAYGTPDYTEKLEARGELDGLPVTLQADDPAGQLRREVVPRPSPLTDEEAAHVDRIGQLAATVLTQPNGARFLALDDLADRLADHGWLVVHDPDWHPPVTDPGWQQGMRERLPELPTEQTSTIASGAQA